MITKQDAANLIDALQEWKDIVQPKELGPDEVGLNDERFEVVMKKLHKILYGNLHKVIYQD
jgi:hypothetical protein